MQGSPESRLPFGDLFWQLKSTLRSKGHRARNSKATYQDPSVRNYSLKQNNCRETTKMTKAATESSQGPERCWGGICTEHLRGGGICTELYGGKKMKILVRRSAVGT